MSKTKNQTFAKVDAMREIAERGEEGKITSLKQMRQIGKKHGITDERSIRTLRKHRHLANALAESMR